MHPRRSRMAGFAALTLCAALAGCGDKVQAPEDYGTHEVTLPDGTKLRAEFMSNPKDVARGMKYRDSLAPDRAMLFQHARQGYYRYWMYEVKIPLDIIWLDNNRRIVQIVHKVPPCPGPQEKCPSYGGAFAALNILELNAGTAAKHNLKPGMVLDY